MEGNEVYQAGEHHIQFGIRMPSKIEAGTFYHAAEQLSARIIYKLEAKLIEKTIAARDRPVIYRDD
jgi:hypothetical protein